MLQVTPFKFLNLDKDKIKRIQDIIVITFNIITLSGQGRDFTDLQVLVIWP